MPEAKYACPMPVLPARVRRTYRGGSLLDHWRGNAELQDGNQPEEWLASATVAFNPGFPPLKGEGLSRVVLNGEAPLLRDILRDAPAEVLGTRHSRRFGSELGVLAKLIDSAERLSIQVHPDKAFAQKYFNSKYGKTECWHVLDTRVINGQRPYLLMGFRSGITKEYWRHLYETQDIPAMIACLNRIEPIPGDTFFIPGGMPHAIGAGCFLIEIQEPTDLTLRSERNTQGGEAIPDRLIHQGLGDELLMECFHYDGGIDADSLDERLRVPLEITHRSNEGVCALLVGLETTPCFSMQKIECNGSLNFRAAGFSVLLAVRGEGKLLHEGLEYPLRQGEHIFIPAGVRDFSLRNGGSGVALECIRCFPPGAVPDSPV